MGRIPTVWISKTPLNHHPTNNGCTIPKHPITYLPSHPITPTTLLADATGSPNSSAMTTESHWRQLTTMPRKSIWREARCTNLAPELTTLPLILALDVFAFLVALLGPGEQPRLAVVAYFCVIVCLFRWYALLLPLGMDLLAVFMLMNCVVRMAL